MTEVYKTQKVKNFAEVREWLNKKEFIKIKLITQKPNHIEVFYLYKRE